MPLVLCLLAASPRTMLIQKHEPTPATLLLLPLPLPLNQPTIIDYGAPSSSVPTNSVVAPSSKLINSKQANLWSGNSWNRPGGGGRRKNSRTVRGRGRSLPADYTNTALDEYKKTIEDLQDQIDTQNETIEEMHLLVESSLSSRPRIKLRILLYGTVW